MSDRFEDYYNPTITEEEQKELEYNRILIEMGKLPKRTEYYDKDAYCDRYRYSYDRLSRMKNNVQEDLLHADEFDFLYPNSIVKAMEYRKINNIKNDYFKEKCCKKTSSSKENGLRKKRKTNIKKTIKQILDMGWFDDLLDKIYDIPIVGNFIGGLFFSLVLIVVCGFVIGMAIMILYAIYKYIPSLLMPVLLLSLNVIAWFSSYRWGCKKYFFWLSLVVSIFFVITCFEYFFI